MATAVGSPVMNRGSDPAAIVFAKKAVSGAWNITVTVLTKSRDAITFLFFRTLNLFSPKLAARLETICLWAYLKWEQFWSERKITNLTEENEVLKTENQDLSTKYTQAISKANRLQGEKDDLGVKNNALAVFKMLLEKQCGRLEKASQDSAKDYKAIQKDLELIRKQLNTVQDQNVNIANQRDSLQEQVNLLHSQLHAKRSAVPSSPTQPSGFTVAQQFLPEELRVKFNRLVTGVCV